MNVNIAWGVFALAWAVVCAVCWYVFVLSKARRGKRCTEHVDGQVVGASDAHRGEVQLPIVEYTVDDATLRVVGPKFRKTFTTVLPVGSENVESGYETNLTSREDLPQDLCISMPAGSIGKLALSPLAGLYPVGSTVDVYYNPKKPRDAYVQRPDGSAQGLSLLLGAFTVGLLAVALVLLCGPTITLV